MKIAIFSGLTCHFEVLGAYIYFCAQNKLDYTLYALKNYHHKWVDFYIKNIDNHMKVHYPNMTQEDFDTFDKIILTTDDDIFFPLRFDGKKIIVTDHELITRRPTASIHFATRPIKNISKPYIYSITPYLSFDNKKKLLNSQNKINICIVGGRQHATDLLKLLNVDWKETNLFVISRAIPKEADEIFSQFTKNYFKEENCDTFKMFDIMSYKKHFFMKELQVRLIYVFQMHVNQLCLKNIILYINLLVQYILKINQL